MTFLPIRNRQPALTLVLAGLILLANGCATPIGVTRADPHTVHRELTGDVLSTSEPSSFTRIVLNRWDLAQPFHDEPAAALAKLHQAVATGQGGADEVFALAELAFLHAEHNYSRAYYLATAVYAYAFLFPQGADPSPDSFDPRLRIAADLYNRGLTAAFASPDGVEVELRAGLYPLPFGQLDVAFDPSNLYWADRRLEHFVPAAELEVYGLRNRYRQPGIGAPLAAGTAPLPSQQEVKLFVPPQVKVPVTALLRLDDPRRQLTGQRLRAVLNVYPATGMERVQIGPQEVPLEGEPTAALAYQLGRSWVWEMEYKGFLRGDFLRSKAPAQLAALEPYRSGRFPVVLVHGTVSSPGRWAEMLNELQNDPQIREHFQFWFFAYDTGSPIVYSALQLRNALQEAVQRLDPAGKDPALHRMVVIGHSQGGLLAKLITIDSGTRLWDAVSRVPLDDLSISEESRSLLRRGLFLESLPFVRRVIFIATPQRGSYVAGNRLSQWMTRLIKLPTTVMAATDEVLTSNPDALPILRGRIGSVYGMTPGHPLVKTLASIPVAPGVAIHSIIAVKSDGPLEKANDGVVEYTSAHLDQADSELVVRSGHSTQGNPYTIAEVRRILRLHAHEACQAGIGYPESTEKK